MFESDFAKSEYIEKDNAVFHVWKKEAHYDDYRNPVIASLEMLKAHKGSLFIVDARNGFEDVKEDVEWGFSYFLPELKKTGCSTWGFILPKVSDIKGEIDLWTREIEKNFRVIRAESYDEILRKARQIEYKDIHDFTEGELKELFLSVDWSSGHFPDKLVMAMKNFKTVYSAWDGDKLIGMICAMDDGIMNAYVHYLLVDPKYHGRTIGRTLVEMMKEHYKDYMRIVLVAYDKEALFYENCGFKKATDASPMFITSLWT